MADDKAPQQPVAERSMASTVIANLAATGTLAKIAVDMTKPKK
jgi:hypothetical protein